MAYQQYHWQHTEVPHVALRRLRAWLRLVTMRRTRLHEWSPREGMPVWEMYAIERVSFLRHWRSESRRPRNYERFGLRKLATR